MKQKIAYAIPLLFLFMSLAGCGGGSSGAGGTSSHTNTAPTLDVTGNIAESIKLGKTYTDAGAVATDAEDGDLTASIAISSNVDTSTLGVYQVSYSVTDSDGNTVQAVRLVQVTSSSVVTDYAVGWENNFSLPPQDANGWSILTPSADSRLIYVSSIDGDDATAQTYLPGAIEVGSDPFNPGVGVKPYATIDSALAQARDGYPDYILLKRGDTWTRNSMINMITGRSVDERAVLGTYGSATARPWVKHHGVQLSDANFSAVVGIRFSATQRDPSSTDFIGLANLANNKGFEMLGGYGNTIESDVLIEDCWFEWFAGNTIQTAAAPLTNIVVRRNIINNNYSNSGHPQGIFSHAASILLEENTFDHNGWYLQAFAGSSQADGVATLYNHNTYFSESRNSIFRRNIFIRSSSIQNKFTANCNTTNSIKAWNILVDNNLYIDGEIGISLGGNDQYDFDDGPRWKDMYVTNNVMMHIGRSLPTNRGLGWGLEVKDWDGGLVKGNIFTSWGDHTNVGNIYAIQTKGDTRDAEFSENIVYDLKTGWNQALVVFQEGNINVNTTFFNNEINGVAGDRLMSWELNETGNFYNNHYYSTAAQSVWFGLNGVTNASLDDYRIASGDTTSVASAPSYVDPGRTIETYLTSLGLATDMDSFVAELKLQSKFNWNEALTAKTINHYIRQGFCLSGNAGCR